MNLLGSWKKRIFFLGRKYSLAVSQAKYSPCIFFGFSLLPIPPAPSKGGALRSFLAGWGNFSLPGSSSHPSQVHPGAGPGAVSGCDQSTVLRTPLHPPLGSAASYP